MDQSSPVPEYPRLQPGTELVPVGAGEALLRSFSGTVMLSGEFVRNVLPAVLPMLDGTRSREALLEEVGDFQPELDNFLRLLGRKGLLVDDTDGLGVSNGADSGASAYWAVHGPGSPLAAGRLRDATVVLAGLGAIGLTVARALAASGVGRLVLVDPGRVGPADVSAGYRADDLARPRAEAALTASDGHHGPQVSAVFAAVDAVQDWEERLAEASLVVLCSDAMTLAGYARTNVASIRAGTPWVSVRVDRGRAVFGPFVIPGQTACFTCFELRNRANADHPEDHQAMYAHWKTLVEAPPHWPWLPPLGSFVGGMVALDVLHVLGGGHMSAVAGRVLIVDLRSFSTRSHELMKLPRCPDCSRLNTRPLTRIWDITAARADGVER